MGEILAFLFFAFIAVLGIVYGAAYLAGWRPDSNQATPLDRAETESYQQLLEAARIFSIIQSQDKTVPILSIETRSDLDAFLADFYHRPVQRALPRARR